jgi:hypothetical protein
MEFTSACYAKIGQSSCSAIKVTQVYLRWRMSRRSGIRFADKDMRQKSNPRRFPFIWDHPVIPYEWETPWAMRKLVEWGHFLRQT